MARTTSPNNNLIINKNIIGSDDYEAMIKHYGIVIYGSPSAKISQNDIFNINPQDYYNDNPCGITIRDASDSALIEKNNITKISYNGGGALGISVEGSNSLILNTNNIANLNAQSSDLMYSTSYHLFGIRINAGIKHRILFNSVNLFGPYMGYSWGGQGSAALIITSPSVDSLEILNNSLVNTKYSETDSSNFAIANIIEEGTGSCLNWAGSRINYNNYYVNYPNAIADTGTCGWQAPIQVYIHTYTRLASNNFTRYKFNISRSSLS